MNKINNKTSFLVLLLLFTFQSSFATIYETTKNGNFNSSNIWTPSKPNVNWNFNDTIYIKHALNITSTVTLAGYIEVKSSGLLIGENKTIEIKRSSTFINNGEIYINKTAYPLKDPLLI